MTSATVLVSALETPTILEQGANTLTTLASVGLDAGVLLSGIQADTALAAEGIGASTLLTPVSTVTVIESQAGEKDILLLAATALGGHRAVRATSVGAVYADAYTLGVSALLGITIHAALVGTPVTIRASGELNEPSWAWVDGPVYLGAQGQLTQTPPIAAAVVEIGVAVTTTTLLVRIQPEVIDV